MPADATTLKPQKRIVILAGVLLLALIAVVVSVLVIHRLTAPDGLPSTIEELAAYHRKFDDRGYSDFKEFQEKLDSYEVWKSEAESRFTDTETEWLAEENEENTDETENHDEPAAEEPAQPQTPPPERDYLTDDELEAVFLFAGNGIPLSPEEEACFFRMQSAQQPARDALKQLLRYEQIRFPRNWDDGFTMVLPELRYLREAAEITSAQRLTAIRTGDRATLLRCNLSFYRLASWCFDDPLLISQLVGFAIVKSMNADFGATLIAAEWNDSELAAMDGQLLQLESLIKMRAPYAYAAEPILAYHWLKKVSFSDLCTEIPGILLTAPFEKNSYFQRCWKIGSLIAQDNDQVRTELAQLKKLPPYALLQQELLPSLTNANPHYSNTFALLRSGRVVIAARRYQLKYGQWPQQQEQLVPEFLEQLPPDPFTGTPLIYELGPLKIRLPHRLPRRNAESQRLQYELKPAQRYGLRVYSLGEDQLPDSYLFPRVTRKAEDPGVELFLEEPSQP